MAKEKLARVRYIPEGQNGEHESYALEMETDNGWGLICQTRFRRCTDYPDAAEQEFIHYTFLNEIFKLLGLGYKIHQC